MRPRDGAWNSNLVLPAPAVRISTISALRLFMPSMTVLANSSSTSMVTSSIGSCNWPLSSRCNNTFGRETVISKPSRRIVSINTPSCNSPLPPISKESLPALSWNVIATFTSASAKRRSLIKVDVTFEPSRPASGESFTVIVTAIVGGSIGVD